MTKILAALLLLCLAGCKPPAHSGIGTNEEKGIKLLAPADELPGAAQGACAPASLTPSSAVGVGIGADVGLPPKR